MKIKHITPGRAKASPPHRHRRQFDRRMQKQEQARRRRQNRLASQRYKAANPSKPKPIYRDTDYEDLCWSMTCYLSLYSSDDWLERRTGPSIRPFVGRGRAPFLLTFVCAILLFINPEVLAETALPKPNFDSIDDASSALVSLERNVTLFDCREKTKGISPGKICFFSEVNKATVSTEHMLKEVKPSDHFTALRTLARAKQLQSIDINVPKIEVVGSGSKTYLATKFDAGFKSESAIHRLVLRRSRSLRVSESKLESFRRNVVAEKIGEIGIAKLAVTGTLVYDVITNPGNWGYNELGLVIIDADLSPTDSTEYYDLAFRMPIDINIVFSLENIMQMKALYQDLLERGDAYYYMHLGITFSEFSEILNNYIAACEQTVKVIGESFPRLIATEPLRAINHQLQQDLRAYALNHPRIIAVM